MRLLRGLGRSQVEGDDGISIVEVLVAITVLAITMAATASSVTRALQVARDSRESVLAANVVQYELERLRAIPFLDWAVAARQDGGTTVDRATSTGPDGQVYEVRRQATWVQAGSATGGCEDAAAGGGGADYVRVSQTVTFPGRDIDPVTNTTIITPQMAFSDPYTGNLAVRVLDRDGAGAPGHRVVVEGAGGLEVVVTDDDGCAFFPYLPADEDPTAVNPYDITIATEGYVDPAGRTAVEEVVHIAAQTTAVLEVGYDRAATVRPSPVVPPPAAGCALQVVVLGTASPGADPTQSPVVPGGGAAPVRALECRTGGAPTPATWQARIPVNLGHRLHNAAADFAATGSRAVDPSSEVVLPDGIAGLFPFADGYGVQAGRCAGSDPQVTGGDLPRATTDPGEVVDVAVPAALVTVRAEAGDGGAVPGAAVFADTRDGGGCPDGERLFVGATGDDGTLLAVLPFGDWVVHWQPAGVAPRALPHSCGEVAAGACTTLRADAARDPVTGEVVAAGRLGGTP